MVAEQVTVLVWVVPAQLFKGKRSQGKLVENQWVNFLGFAHRFY